MKAVSYTHLDVYKRQEINGINRIEEFIQQCSFRGWLVNRINVLNRVEIYQKAEEDIVFDEYF